MPVETLAEGVALYCADCLDALKTLEPNSVDACVTDPPYGLSFMGKHWDHGVPGIEYWKLIIRSLKPGAHLLSFGGTRTYHRMACAIEDAGFEIRDSIQWLYGSGFPKSLDVSKAIDKAAGVNGSYGEPKSDAHAGWIDRGAMRGDDGHEGYQRPWMQDEGAVDRAARRYIPGSPEAEAFVGFGTALKPACEPIVMARKPLIGTVAENVLQHGTGALNIDGCRVEHVTVDGGSLAANPHLRGSINGGNGGNIFPPECGRRVVTPNQSGRWPANVIHDGSDDVVGAFPETSSGLFKGNRSADKFRATYGAFKGTPEGETETYGDSGSAARFFYTAKADGDDRLGSKHPTVKPVDLMQYLVRLVTPRGGLVLDPFAGTGTTGEACIREGMRAILIEREAEYQEDIRRRMKLAMSGPLERKHVAAAAKYGDKPFEPGSLFANIG